MRCSSSLTSLREQIRLDEGTVVICLGAATRRTYIARGDRSPGNGVVMETCSTSSRLGPPTPQNSDRTARSSHQMPHSAQRYNATVLPLTRDQLRLAALAWRLEILGIGARARAVEVRSGMAVGQ
jgi:hypothetical protein